MNYSEDELLPLSGIQHFAYCPRQWALIHVEGVWQENHYTLEGRLQHEKVDDVNQRKKYGDIITLRCHPVVSTQLGLYGVCDIIELHATDAPVFYTNSIYPGKWNVYPVEYKHGKPKNHDSDLLQLAAQAMCLEEMYGLRIEEGAVFYHAIKHRLKVEINDLLREDVYQKCKEMHIIHQRHDIPAPVEDLAICRGCSLKEVCMPEISRSPKASEYNYKNLYEKVT